MNSYKVFPKLGCCLGPEVSPRCPSSSGRKIEKATQDLLGTMLNAWDILCLMGPALSSIFRISSSMSIPKIQPIVFGQSEHKSFPSVNSGLRFSFLLSFVLQLIRHPSRQFACETVSIRSAWQLLLMCYALDIQHR